MKALLQSALLDAADAKISRYRERTRTASFARWNATINRNLPDQPDDGADLSLGLIHALGQIESSDSTGASGQQSAASGTSGAAGGDAAAVVAGQATASGPAAANSNGTAGNLTGGNSTPPGATGPSALGRLWRKAWPWLVAGASTGLVGTGIGTAVNWWLLRERSPTSTVIVEQDAPRDASLYQWLEDNGHHLPPEEAP